MYGHQYGHALEYVSKDKYYHGEAVNVGMIGASHVDYVLGIHDDKLIDVTNDIRYVSSSRCFGVEIYSR